MINLYLLGEKGNVALRSICETNLGMISLVIVGSDKNVVNDYSAEIIDYCKNKNIKYLRQNKSVNIDIARYTIAIGWRWLINDAKTLIVFHDSILPRQRGFNPLVTSLINGNTEVGVTVLFGGKDFDRGEIIIQKRQGIVYPIKIKTAIEIISLLYGEALNELISQIKMDKVHSIPQDDSIATYSLWRDNDDYKIDWTESSESINRFINAVGYPYKGAFTMLNNNKYIIKDSYIEDDVVIENRIPGKVLFKKTNRFIIVCGKGLLGVENFYDESGNSIEFKNFRLKFT
jgi:methionyl-tRNA formyltransferase